MTEECTLTLNREDVLQIRDALEEKLRVWFSTVRYIRGESGVSDSPVLADCDKAREALQVAQHYQDIIAKIDCQIS